MYGRAMTTEPAAISISEEGPDEFLCCRCDETFDGFMAWRCEHLEFFDCCWLCAELKLGNVCSNLSHIKWEPEPKEEWEEWG